MLGLGLGRRVRAPDALRHCVHVALSRLRVPNQCRHSRCKTGHGFSFPCRPLRVARGQEEGPGYMAAAADSPRGFPAEVTREGLCDLCATSGDC